MVTITDATRRRRKLPRFSPVVSAWMRRRFDAPTEAQRLAWPAIAQGKSTLVFSPTGSGKTLAAFLWAVNELVEVGERGALPATPYVVYISPLRALANDVEKNLLLPLAERRALAAELEAPFPDIEVTVRTGDTLAGERQRMLRRPPQLFITTPESLYLMLPSSFQAHLRAVRHVSVDEVHHLCGDKRGAHLALSLERLEELQTNPESRIRNSKSAGAFTRIGLSATQSPVDEIARFLLGRDDEGNERHCTVVDLGAHRALDLRVLAPVPNLVEAKPEEVWQAIYEQLFELILEHRTTLVLCDSRHYAEQVAAKLNMLAEGRGLDLRIGAHQGSMSRPFRLELEDKLRSGELRARGDRNAGVGDRHRAPRSRLPSGTPKAGFRRFAACRAGRALAGADQQRATVRHQPRRLGRVGGVDPRRMQDGSLEPVHFPTNCLDVVAQQVTAVAAMDASTGQDLLRVSRRAYNFRSRSDADFDRVLQQLSGRYRDSELYDLPTRLSFDRASDQVTSARGALTLV